MIKVEVAIPGGQSQSFDIDKTSFTIGRSKDADITLKVEGMSRKHLQIDLDGEQLYVIDLNSSNGVFVNEEKIEAGKKVEYHSFLPLTVCAGVAITLNIE